MTLLQGDSVPRDHSLVECESGFRAIALDEFSDRMIIGSRGTGRYQAVPTEIPDSGKGKVRYSHERALICDRGKCLLPNGGHCRFHVIGDGDLRVGSAEIRPRAVDVQGDVFYLKDLDRLVAAIRAKGIWWKMRAICYGLSPSRFQYRQRPLRKNPNPPDPSTRAHLEERIISR